MYGCGGQEVESSSSSSVIRMRLLLFARHGLCFALTGARVCLGALTMDWQALQITRNATVSALLEMHPSACVILGSLFLAQLNSSKWRHASTFWKDL